MGVAEKFAQVQKLNAQIADLKRQKDALETELKSEIPENDVVDGVRHVVIVKRTVSYAKAVARIKAALSGVELARVTRAVNLHTGSNTVHRIQEAAE